MSICEAPPLKKNNKLTVQYCRMCHIGIPGKVRKTCPQCLTQNLVQLVECSK